MKYFLSHPTLADEDTQVFEMRLGLDLTFEVDETSWADWMRNWRKKIPGVAASGIEI